MRRLAILALTGTAALSLATSAFADSRTFELSGFDHIDIATGLDAHVTIGEQYAVVATSNSSQALDSLQIRVERGVLTARIEQSFLDFIISGGLVGMLLSSGNAVSIDITLPALAGATASSGADIDLTGISGDRLELDASSGAHISGEGLRLGAATLSASSGADITVSGTARSVEADASSGAGIEAEDLIAETASASASSGANVSLHATQSVKAEASSGGDVDVSGDPAQRDVDSSSGGDVSFDD